MWILHFSQSKDFADFYFRLLITGGDTTDGKYFISEKCLVNLWFVLKKYSWRSWPFNCKFCSLLYSSFCWEETVERHKVFHQLALKTWLTLILQWHNHLRANIASSLRQRFSSILMGVIFHKKEHEHALKRLQKWMQDDCRYAEEEIGVFWEITQKQEIQRAGQKTKYQHWHYKWRCGNVIRFYRWLDGNDGQIWQFWFAWIGVF